MEARYRDATEPGVREQLTMALVNKGVTLGKEVGPISGVTHACDREGPDSTA
jgi:hypothetical protein